ncbi:MAG: hypothetical protein P4L87_25175 [Formivibrio sp.]|nr:hypothetical protein [Formivibrio sp.]
MFCEDMAAFFADGVVATFNGVDANVWLNMPDHSVLGDMQISSEYAIEFVTGALPGIAHGRSITVDGIAYTVREVTKIDDGATSVATLSKS